VRLVHLGNVGFANGDSTLEDIFVNHTQGTHLWRRILCLGREGEMKLASLVKGGRVLEVDEVKANEDVFQYACHATEYRWCTRSLFNRLVLWLQACKRRLNK
jgi:hypothetical protein